MQEFKNKLRPRLPNQIKIILELEVHLLYFFSNQY